MHARIKSMRNVRIYFLFKYVSLVYANLIHDLIGTVYLRDLCQIHWIVEKLNY